MNNQRTLQEEKRIKEKTIIIKTGKKYYKNDKKKLHKNFLDMQVNEQMPIKLSKENYYQNNISEVNNSFHNSNLYELIPQYS